MPATTAPKRLRVRPIDPALARFVRAKMKDTGTPGVSVGVWHKGRAFGSGFGVTSVEAPDPVDENTLFQIGSTGKTYTASAVMRLVDRGEIDLDAPVRRYIRDLKLRDPDVAKKVTVRHLLTHMGGWAGDFFTDTGRGSDALEKVVASLGKIPQLTPLGEVWHYNNAGFYVAGRILEKVMKTSYEQAISELLLEPLGMTRSFHFAEEAIVYRVAAGHNAASPGSKKHSIAVPWDIGRSSGPAGGLISDVVDQMRWAQFHLGDGRSPTGKRLLKKSTLRMMQKPQAPAGNLAHYVGISWLLEDYGDVRLVKHGGTTHGQLSAFLMVPERDFAITVLTNSSRGIEVHGAVVRKALSLHLGLERQLPEVRRGAADELARYEGRYVDAFKTAAIDIDVAGGRLKGRIAPIEEAEDATRLAPFHMAPFADDEMLVQGGRLDGLTAEFIRDGTNRVKFIRFGGRLWRKGPSR